MKNATDLAVDVCEQDWIEGIRRSDVPAFEAMVRACGPRLAHFAIGLLDGRRADAEDVVQDVLWRVWHGRADWRPAVSLRAYPFTAVRNRALNLLQRGRVRARYQAATHHGAQHDAELYAIRSPAATLDEEEERVAVTSRNQVKNGE
jgi:RNA polymerase sigma factor (sigma-70 family)